MSNETLAAPPIPQPVVPVASPLKLKELAALLVKQYDLHEGLYDLMLEFRIGVGSSGPTEAERLPSAMVSIGAVGLTRATQAGPTTVDAAEVNPAPTKPAKGRKRKD